MPAERMAKNRVGRYLSLLPALLTFGLGIYALTPPALNAGQEYFRRDDLSRDAEALHKALLEARASALRKAQAVGVSMDSSGWIVFEDKGRTIDKGEAVLSGVWSSETKIGTNIPDGRFFFEKDGACRISSTALCAKDDWQHPERAGHVVTIASDARRICRIFFDGTGTPLIECGDF